MANPPSTIRDRVRWPAITVTIIVGWAIIRRAPMVITMAPISMAIPAIGRAKTKTYAPSVPRVVAY